jgi:glycosyltransferase involved in cell wall biosynthesis
MKTVVQILTTDQYPLWDAFADESPQGAVFCYTWWLKAVTKDNFRIPAVFENGKIVAGIPLAYYLGKINEPPLTRTLGPLFKDLSHLSAHHRTTLERKWLNLLLDHIPLGEVEQFCTSHNFTDWLPFRWHGLKQTSRYTYMIDYAGKSERDLWSGLNRGRKETIQKALKKNISVIVTSELCDFYKLIGLTYQRQGLVFNLQFDDFKTLDDEIVKHQQRVILTAFDDEGNAHAAIYVVYHSREAFALLSAGDPKYRHSGGHTLVMWEALKHFHSKVKFFNFGGSDIQRIEDHLRGFGGELKPYFHIYAERPQIKEVERITEKEVIREVTLAAPPPPDDFLYHLHIVFRHGLHLVKKALHKIGFRFYVPPRVSVVTACFNHGRYIREMLDSVFAQTYQNFEVIIVNDGSNDETYEILKRIRHKSVRIFHTAKHGPAHARNLAITHARGEYIINLDADDKIAPEFLQKCVEVMDANPITGIVYSDVVLFGAKNGPFEIHDFSIENMLRANCIVANACFRKTDWEKTEGYPVFMQCGYEDFVFWLSILKLGREVKKINEPLVCYRTYENTNQSRSGRQKQCARNMDQVIIQAFRMHRAFYKTIPAVYDEFVEREKAYALATGEHPLINHQPVFSIITPTHKRPELLKRNIESVRRQSFTNWEQLVIDDANQPETLRLVESFNDPRLKYIAHPEPKGAAGAYNTGLKNAMGKFINFLDDDDEYLPGILEKIGQAFVASDPKPGFVWTGITRVKDTAGGEEVIRTQVWPQDFDNHEQGLMVSTAIGNGFGLSIKRECLKKTGFYDESFVVGEDTDFMMRLSQYYHFRTVPEVLVKIHHHGDTQLTHEKYLPVRCEAYKKLLAKNKAFIQQHWDACYMHHSVYVDLCFRIQNKAEGFKALIALAVRFPGRKILWLDFVSYLFYGTDYVRTPLKRNWKGIRVFISGRS